MTFNLYTRWPKK